jgi:hypothetical protein
MNGKIGWRFLVAELVLILRLASFLKRWSLGRLKGWSSMFY